MKSLASPRGSVKASRKPRPKPARRVRLYGEDSNPMLLEMTVGPVDYAYFVSPIDADFGMAFEFRKPLPETDVYHVHIDTDAGHHSCTCPGGTYHDHCKHLEAILALLACGKLAMPKPKDPKPATPSTPILPLPLPMKPAATAPA